MLRQAEDGAWRQIETITMSWCDTVKLHGYIERADAGGFDAGRTCNLCA